MSTLNRVWAPAVEASSSRKATACAEQRERDLYLKEEPEVKPNAQVQPQSGQGLIRRVEDGGPLCRLQRVLGRGQAGGGPSRGPRVAIAGGRRFGCAGGRADRAGGYSNDSLVMGPRPRPTSTTLIAILEPRQARAGAQGFPRRSTGRQRDRATAEAVVMHMRTRAAIVARRPPWFSRSRPNALAKLQAKKGRYQTIHSRSRRAPRPVGCWHLSASAFVRPLAHDSLP